MHVYANIETAWYGVLVAEWIITTETQTDDLCNLYYIYTLVFS